MTTIDTHVTPRQQLAQDFHDETNRLYILRWMRRTVHGNPPHPRQCHQSSRTRQRHRMVRVHHHPTTRRSGGHAMTQRVQATYHREGGTWWAESEEAPGFTAAGDTLKDVRPLVRQRMEQLFPGADLDIYERHATHGGLVFDVKLTNNTVGMQPHLDAADDTP